MITDILLSWNVLTATMIIWLGITSLAFAVDMGPEAYHDRKIVQPKPCLLFDAEREAIAQYRTERQELSPVYVIEKPVASTSRRHARV